MNIQSTARTLIVDSKQFNVLQWPIAESEDYLDYYLNLTELLNPNNDSISSVVANSRPSGPGELVIESLDVNGYTVAIWLSGGVPTRIYTVRIDVTTKANRIISLLAFLPIDSGYSISPFPLPYNPDFGTSVLWPSQGIILEDDTGFWNLESGLGYWAWG